MMNDLRLNDYELRVDSSSGIESRLQRETNGPGLPESDDAWIEELVSNIKATFARLKSESLDH